MTPPHPTPPLPTPHPPHQTPPPPPKKKGLRTLQGRQQLESLVRFVKDARDKMAWGPPGPPPLLVKIAPDLTESDKADIAAVAAATGVDGLVVGNTTVSRPGGFTWGGGRLLIWGKGGCWGCNGWGAGGRRKRALLTGWICGFGVGNG